jgi:predicted nucleic acid-binding Zn ribbon protein
MRCPNCGKEVPPEEHFFCPFCGKSLLTKSSKRYGKFPLVSGILTIIASVLVLVAGLSTILEALNTYGGFGYGFIDYTNVFFWASGILYVIAFAIGLTSSIFQIRKRQISIAILGIVLLLVSAAMLVGQSYFVIQLADRSYVNGSYLFFAIPLFVLLTSSLILVGVSRKEF